MAKIITVDVDPLGGVKIETSGYSGAECEAATKELEKALGSSGGNTRTAEFFKPVQQVKQGQR